MKKIISFALALSSVLSFAQISFSGKANLVFPTGSPTWKNISNTAVNAYGNGGKNNVGFNVGLSAKISTPTSFFVMPEVYFTSFKNEFTEPNTNTQLEAKNDRIDVPVLLGYNVMGEMLGLFVGPVASYNFSNSNQYNNFIENAKNDFTVGYQFGAQAKLQKFIVNARYEGAFTKDQRNFIDQNNYTQIVAGSNFDVSYDNRPSIFIVGVGYEF